MYQRELWRLYVAVLLLVGVGAKITESFTSLQVVRIARIVDERDRPVEFALVEIDSAGSVRAVRADSAGLIVVHVAASERRARLRVSKMGYTPWQGIVTWNDDSQPAVVRLVSVAEALSEVRVRASAPVASRLHGVDQRIARGTPNASITRSAIEKRNPIAISQMLRGIAGVRLADSSGATVAVSTRGAKLERLRPVQCVMRISVDGVVLSPSTSIDQIPPIDVHAIEVYFGPARIPPEFAGIRTDSWCGLIAIWTRSGE